MFRAIIRLIVGIWKKLVFFWHFSLMMVAIIATVLVAGSELRLAPPPSSPKSLQDSSGAGGNAALEGRGGGNILDPARPCFSREQAVRMERVLFRDKHGQDAAPWLEALNMAFHRLGIPCSNEGFLLLALTTIQLESGVRADPPLVNADLEALFDYKLQEIRQGNLLAEKVLDRARFDDALRSRLRQDTRRGHVKTEGDLGRYVEGELREWVAEYMLREFFIPLAVGRFAVQQALSNPVNTIGPMQVNVAKAYRNALGRQEALDGPSAMQKLLLDPGTALYRGVLEGVHQLWIGYAYYGTRMNPEDAVLYTAADYNAGEFSSRNAAFQERVSLLSGHELLLDGDLLLYDGPSPRLKASNTEAALLTLGAGLQPDKLRTDLLLEKQNGFDKTKTAGEVCRLYRERRNKSCLMARLPSGAVNEAARLKTGQASTPARYARAYLRRWRSNRTLYYR